MKRRLLQLMLALLCCIPLWAGHAKNVRVQQRDKDIVITYDLKKTSNVRLLMSVGNSSFTPLRAVSGDVGSHIHAGNNLTITWHPLQERETFIADNVRFKVEALSAYEQYARPWYKGGRKMETFILGEFAYSFAPQMSYGFMFGQTYKHGIGWFAELRTNFNFKYFNGYDGVYLEKDINLFDYEYPFATGRTQTSILVAHYGFVIDILDAMWLPDNRFNTFAFYVGLGMGSRGVYWETSEGKWNEYGPASLTHFSGSIGVMGSLYGLTLKAGVNTIGFKYMEIETGIGWMF